MNLHDFQNSMMAFHVHDDGADPGKMNNSNDAQDGYQHIPDFL